MMTEAALVSFIAALFSMMNPIGNLGVFAGMTSSRTEQQARHAALICAIAVAITLLIVTWSGDLLLRLFGVSVDALRIAGGVIVFLIGLRMLFNNKEHSSTPEENQDAQSHDSIGVVPLAIPIVAGPGTMATVLVAAQQDGSVLSKMEISVVVVVAAALTGVLFSFAGPLAEKMGASGMGVVTRVMGLILTTIATTMLMTGLRNALPGLAG